MNIIILAGWNLAEASQNCADACSAVGLECSEDGLYAHNADVDSSEEVLNLIRTLGGEITAEDCTGTATNQPGVPLYVPGNDKCTISDAARDSSSFDCGHVPTPVSKGKRRLCWCNLPGKLNNVPLKYKFLYTNRVQHNLQLKLLVTPYNVYIYR